MKVYPKPASEEIHIRLPECLRNETNTEHFTVSTTFHKWVKNLKLFVFETLGRLIITRTIKSAEKRSPFPFPPGAAGSIPEAGLWRCNRGD